jgi:hypothetical protein
MLGLVWALAGFPVELLPREGGRPFKEWPPGTEHGRAARVVDEVANEPFDARALKDENHCLLSQENAVPPKTGLAELVRRALGEDLTRSLARARPELDDHRHALSHITASRR